jgi:hypothetical protein
VSRSGNCSGGGEAEVTKQSHGTVRDIVAVVSGRIPVADRDALGNDNEAIVTCRFSANRENVKKIYLFKKG